VVTPTPRAPRKVRVTQYATAFAVGLDTLVTSASAIDANATIYVQSSDGQSITAKLIRKDETTGLALLKIEGRRLAALPLADGFTSGAVTCPSFPTVDLFNPAPQVITGTAPAAKDGQWTISLAAHPRLAGAPIIAGGKVVGVCLASRDAEKTKLPAVTLDQLKTFLGADAKPAAFATDPAAAILQVVASVESVK
jgi:hypothetical protein